MAFDQIPYARKIPESTRPVINPNARCSEFIEQAYAFFNGLDGLSRDVGRKARLATASGADWRRNPTAFGMGVKLAGSTGYFAAPGHQLRPWSRECLFVYGATGAQALSGIAHVPGSDTYDRTLYVNSSNLIAAHIYDGVGKFVAGTTALTVGQAYHVLVTCSDSLMSIYLNGVLEGSTAINNAGFQGYATPQLVFGYGFAASGTPAGTTNTLFYHIEYNSVLSAKDVRHRYLNQLEMFQAGQAPIIVGASSAITGTLTATEAGDTTTATGVLPLTGSAAITEVGDTLSAAGALAITGAASITESDDTLTATGTLAVAGALSATEADDTLTSAGALPITGAASITEAGDTTTATGALAIKGSMAVTEADDTLTAAGTGAQVTTGALNATEADDTLSASGVLPVTGSAAITESGDTLAATGVLPATGAASITEDSDSAVSSGALAISGAANITEAGDTLSASTAAEVNAIVFRIPAEPATFRIAAEPVTFRIAA